MNISVEIKSGTGGYYDYDGCSMQVAKITQKDFPIPRVGETLSVLEDDDKKRTNVKGEVFKEYHDYLVTEVFYWIANNSYGVTIYVIPIGRSVNI